MQRTSTPLMASLMKRQPGSRKAFSDVCDYAIRYASKDAATSRGITTVGPDGGRRIKPQKVGGLQRVVSQLNAKTHLGPRIRSADIEVFTPRRFTREEHMWRDPKKLHVKWLLPRDPTRYKPNFAAVEPKALMKQFTRSPDERTRNVLGSDWEKTIRAAKDKSRPKLLAGKTLEQYETMQEAKAISRARQSRAKGYVDDDTDDA